MKNFSILFLLFIFLFLGFIQGEKSSSQANPRVVKTLGTFEKSVIYQAPSPWYLVVQGTAEIEEYGAKDGVFYVKINNPGNDFWHIQFGQHIPIRKGISYKLLFDAKSDKERDIQVRVIQDQTWKIVVKSIFNLIPEKRTYTWEFTPSEEAQIIVFDFGKISDKSIATTVYLDNVILEEY